MRLEIIGGGWPQVSSVKVLGLFISTTLQPVMIYYMIMLMICFWSSLFKYILLFKQRVFTEGWRLYSLWKTSKWGLINFTKRLFQNIVDNESIGGVNDSSQINYVIMRYHSWWHSCTAPWSPDRQAGWRGWCSSACWSKGQGDGWQPTPLPHFPLHRSSRCDHTADSTSLVIEEIGAMKRMA